MLWGLAVDTDRRGPLDQVLQLGVAELQADDVVELLPLRGGRVVVAPPLGHGHLDALLRVDVHHVHYSPAACGTPASQSMNGT